jgi:iron complex outermembrane receptor protein
MMIRLCIFILISCAAIISYSEETLSEFDMFDEELNWEEGTVLGEALPMVLTASRLKQPKAEVPGSVTVIDAEQIELWGARTLPELMKFVPGMFVGHADGENNASVTYHTSSPNIMRRLQVLIDGRSVYKSAISNVIWDDLPLAIEDIDRIEVMRGPNAAMYGANSYLGVINILTKHPADSLGTRISLRKGNKGVQDLYMRHGLIMDSTSVRLTAAINGDEGFDGRDSTGTDALRDGRRHGFVNAYINHELDEKTNIDVQLGYKSGKTEMRQIDFDTSPPDKTTRNGYVYSRWSHEFNVNHQSHLQFYWQKEDRQQKKEVCAPTLSLDPDLGDLYRENPEWADAVGYIPVLYNDPESDFSQAELEALVAGLSAGVISSDYIADELGYDVTDADLINTQNILNKASDSSTLLNEISCGVTDSDLGEQRIDIEWQDTMRWNDEFRTVSGISYRQDSAYSQTYFNGEVNNETWRVFLNAEYRLMNTLLFNIGGMYEEETFNDAAFSPRIAMNWLLSPRQSMRFVVSQAVRSPDLLESQPDFTFTVKNLALEGGGINYLNQDKGVFFQSQYIDEDEENLTQEKITSYEIGYFSSAQFLNSHIEMDLKLFYEEMRDLVSDPITLQAKNITNDNEVDVNGAEIQINTRFNPNHSLWFTYSYIDVDTHYTGNLLTGRDLERAEEYERRLTSENSVVASWLYDGKDWSASLSYFYQDSRNFDLEYERIQLNVIKPFTISDFDFKASYYLQHNLKPDNPLNYSNQIYSTPNVFYAQIAVEF